MKNNTYRHNGSHQSIHLLFLRGIIELVSNFNLKIKFTLIVRTTIDLEHIIIVLAHELDTEIKWVYIPLLPK